MRMDTYMWQQCHYHTEYTQSTKASDIRVIQSYMASITETGLVDANTVPTKC